MAPERMIKIGRSNIAAPVAKHWAIKVGDTWFELEGAGKNDQDSPNHVRRSRGFAAASGAGFMGGDVAGKTTKTDEEIDEFLADWLRRNPTYNYMTDNCQKFVYEFGMFLTGGVNFRLPFRLDAGNSFSNNMFSRSDRSDSYHSFDEETGTFIAREGTYDDRFNLGLLNVRNAGPYEETCVKLGRGAWIDKSAGRMEVSYGNLVGAHFEPNLNTGVGMRGGNLDVHAAGFGFKAGADGLEVNTPLGGVNACLIM